MEDSEFRMMPGDDRTASQRLTSHCYQVHATATSGCTKFVESRRGRNASLKLRPIAICAVRKTAPASGAASNQFLDIAGLQEPNPLLYRCFPLTCARSQE
jgi:hypothetical protein